MEIGAFIISLVALAASGAAVWYTRRQAVANEVVAKIEKARRVDEVAAVERRRFRLIGEPPKAVLVNEVDDSPAYGVKAKVDWRRRRLRIGKMPPHKKVEVPLRGRTARIFYHLAPDLSDPRQVRVVVVDDQRSPPLS